MLLSRTCEYGIRAMMQLATKSPHEFIAVRKISNELEISFHFLTKICQQLSRAGLVRSYRGPNGGVKLAKPASKISLMEIVVAIEGSNLFTECVLGLPGCGDESPCPLHDSWAHVRGELIQMLEKRSLSQIAEDVAARNLRLKGTLR